jgi:MFS family permease
LVLRPVDATLAGAVVYTFASRAVCPKSSVVFEWLHDPGPPSQRCWTEAACAALNATPAASALSCGWAKARDYPCIDPVTVSWVYVAGNFALLLGVWFYVSLMQHWSFRRTFVVTQTLICAFSFFDLLWIRRVNRALGVSDSVWCLFGNELARDFVYKLNQMPFMIYAAKLCPRGTEASMFALFMGLSNFGTTAGGYLGSSLLQAYGGVEAPEFENLETFVMTACLMQATPILMVPYLVPLGSPVGTAQEMGAGRAILGDGQDDMPPEITSCCRASSELSCSRDDIELTPRVSSSSSSDPAHSSSAAHSSKSMSQRRAEPWPDADVVVVRA